MLRRHRTIAAFFLFGGLAIVGGIGALIALGNMEAGMSDGIEGGVVSPTQFLIFLGLYFICGLVASLVPKMAVRKFLVVFAHAAPLPIFWFSRGQGFGAEGILAVLIGVVYAFYACFWIRMLSERKDPVGNEPLQQTTEK